MKSMKSRLVWCAVVLGLLMIIAPVIAKGPKGPKGPKRGPTGPAGKSKIGRLYLVQKEPADPNWPVVSGGAFGKMIYRTSAPKFAFNFNGHRLVAGQDYTLIYFPDKEGNPWPRTDIICLGSDRADEDGNIHIREVVDTGDLPNPDADINTKAKIWLVLSDDVDCIEEMIMGWDPAEYLFEYDGILFDSTID